MKFFRLATAIIISFSILVLVSACNTQSAVENSITLSDQTGRTVTLNKKAERVVSCYYVTTYAMLSLGLGDKLVGIEKKADSRPIYSMAYPDLLDLPTVGSLKEINIEAIAALTPDLVVLPKKLRDSASTLEALGISTVIVDPETSDKLYEMLRLIGKACGVTEKADNIISFCNSKTDGFAPQGTAPTVLFCGNSSYLSVAPSGMYQNDVITLAGGVNSFGNSSENYWQEISYETFLQCNPDYIVIPAGASYSADDIKNDVMLSELKAVKNNHVVTVPNTFEEWDSPIPSGFLGILWLRSVLYPSLYNSESFRKDVSEFYETFYGFTPSSEILQTIK